MNEHVIHRFALLFMAAAAALTSSFWAHHDQAPTQRTADTTQGTRAVVRLDKDAGSAGRLVAVPFDPRHVELSGDLARAEREGD